MTTLERFAALLRQRLDDAAAAGHSLVRGELHYLFRIDEFDYRDDGPHVGSSSGSWALKPTFPTGHVGEAMDSVRSSKEWRDAAEALAGGDRGSANGQVWGNLANLLQSLARIHYLGGEDSAAGMRSVLVAFLAEERGAPLDFVVEAAITRVVPPKGGLSFVPKGFTGVSLRRVAKDDLEDDCPAYDIRTGQAKPWLDRSLGDFALPASILTLRCSTKSREGLAERIEEAQAVLRLFWVAAVDIVDHRLTPQGVFGSGLGRYSSSYYGMDRYMRSFGRYSIDSDSICQFKSFWSEIGHLIPQAIVAATPTEPQQYIKISYDRYCDALFHAHSHEERIANAVMGLEALLLPSGDHGELSYRLRLYAAKLIGSMGHDSLQVRTTVSDAYAVRSAYVHGSKVAKSQAKAIGKRHGDLKQLCPRILEYLRVGIVAAIVAGRRKDDFVRMIDDSLLSQQAGSELDHLARKTRPLVAREQNRVGRPDLG